MRAWAVGIAVATVVAYSNSFSGTLFFDDTASIVENKSIRQLWPLSDVLFAPAIAGTAGRPLLNLSFALNFAAGGLAPSGYHAVNLAIHLAAALVLFGLVRRALSLAWARARFAAHATELGALVALLWAVHPLQTESVTYVSQRAESLVGLFYLLTWYAFVRAAEPGAPRRWGVLSVAACVAGVLTKEIIVTAPVVILIFDRVFLSASWREAWTRRRGIYLGYAGALLLLGVMMLGSRLQERGVGFGGKIGWGTYLATACEALALYLKLSVWPHPLIIDYGPTPARGGGILVLSGAVLAAWLGLVAATWRRWPGVAFASFAILAMLAPTLVVPIANQPVAEHRMYLPLAVVVTLVVVMGFLWLGRRGVMAGGLVLAVAGVGGTMARNADYRTEVTIWRDAATKRPDNWRAHATLALAYFSEQRLDEGVAALEVALRLNPTEGKLHNNYANALAVVGRLPEAIAAGQRATQLDPTYAEARSSLAQALLKAGRAAEAVVQLEAARDLKPESVEIRSNLCDALRRVGRATEAVKEGEVAVRLRDDFSPAHCNLGLALVEVGRTDEAIAHYETALRLKPDYLEVRNNLGVTLMNTGRLPEAQAQLEEAIRLKPTYAEAHNSLGIVFAKVGRLDEAGREFETALRLQPDHVNAQNNLKLLRSMQEQAAKK